MNLKGLGLALMALSSAHGAQAAEVKVLASNSVRTMLEDVAPLFTRASGHTVTLGFGTSAQVAKRVLAGEAVDLLVVTPDVVDVLAKANKLAGSSTSIARSLMGIGVRAGTPHPDIGTPAALRKTLLAVKSVTFSDPGTGAASGVHTVKIFEQLGIADEMQPKYRLGDGTSSGRLAQRWQSSRVLRPSGRGERCGRSARGRIRRRGSERGRGRARNPQAELPIRP